MVEDIEKAFEAHEKMYHGKECDFLDFQGGWEACEFKMAKESSISEEAVQHCYDCLYNADGQDEYEEAHKELIRAHWNILYAANTGD